MTVSSNSLTALTIGEIITDAYGLAGLLNENQTLDTAQNQRAMRFLRASLARLQAKGIYVRAIDFYTLTLTAGTASYTTSSGTLDLVGDGMFLASGATTGEISVTPIMRDEYHQLPDKVSQSTPRLYYAHREQTPPVVYLWPVPSETGSTVKFQRHKLLANVDSTSDNVDLEQHWAEYLQWDLAHKLANAASLEVNVRGYLRGEKERAFKDASGYSRERPATQIHLDHRTPWSH